MQSGVTVSCGLFASFGSVPSETSSPSDKPSLSLSESVGSVLVVFTSSPSDKPSSSLSESVGSVPKSASCASVRPSLSESWFGFSVGSIGTVASSEVAP